MSAIPAISGVSAVAPLFDPAALTGATAPTAAAGTVTGVNATSSSPFAQALEKVSALETDANVKAVELATGQLNNIQDFTAAAARANLAIDLTAAIRNRALDALSEVMRMQV